MAFDKKKSQGVLQDLAALIRYHGDIGVDTYHLPEDFFHPLSAVAKQPKESEGKKIAAQGGNAPEFLDDTLITIASDIQTCVLCQEADGSCLRVYGCGPRSARLFLILGDDTAGSGEGMETFLNDEEDRLLTKMLQAIGLTRQEVFVAGLSKCFTSNGKVVGTDRCTPFLLRQLAVVRPKVLCIMGGRAAKIILRTAEPLSRIRGRFSYLKTLPHADIRVVATYHPRLLLQHEEMKRASWTDLKNIQKELG